MIVCMVTHPDGSSISFFHSDIIEMQRFEAVSKPYTLVNLIDGRVVVCLETPKEINDIGDENE